MALNESRLSSIVSRRLISRPTAPIISSVRSSRSVALGADHAVARVFVEQAEGDLVDRRLDGGDLGEDVDAVAVLVDHPLEAADLAGDPAQAVLDLVLVVDVAAADGSFSAICIGFSSARSVSASIYPQGVSATFFHDEHPRPASTALRRRPRWRLRRRRRHRLAGRRRPTPRAEAAERRAAATSRGHGEATATPAAASASPKAATPRRRRSATSDAGRRAGAALLDRRRATASR